MINPLAWIRIRFPYVWRLRPHAVIPLALLLACGLWLFGGPLVQWDFSELQSIEQIQEKLSLYKLMLQFLVVLALVRWLRQLIAFPLYGAGWYRILPTLLFYWVVIACAFLGPELAIDRGLRALHEKFPDAPAAQQDLDSLRTALCEVESGSEPAPDLLEIFARWYGSADRSATFRPLHLVRNSGERWLTEKAQEGQEDGSHHNELELRQLLWFCKHEHLDAFYKIREFSAFLFQIEEKDSDEALQVTSDLIGGLATVVALGDYVKSVQGPFAVHAPIYLIYEYFSICLLVAVGLLLVTERTGRGSSRLGQLAERLRNRLLRLAPSVFAARMARSNPVVWSLGLPRIFSDAFIFLCFAFLIGFVPTQLVLIFMASGGEVNPLVQNSSVENSLLLFLLLYLIPLSGWFVLREPIERTRFPGFWRNCLYTMLAITHFSLVYVAGMFGIFLAYEALSHLHGFSSFSDLQINRGLLALLFITSTIIYLSVVGSVATITRISYLAGGLRMGASTFVTIIAVVLTLMILIEESWFLQYIELGFWLGMGGLTAALRWYPVQRFSHPVAHGVFLGVLVGGGFACGVGALVVYRFEIETVLEFQSWYKNFAYGPISILEPIWLSFTCLVVLAAWNLGLKRVTRAMATPR